jgi:hypothetical protein
VPYIGVLAGALFGAGTFLESTSDKYADPKAVQFFNDHATQNLIASVTSAFFCVTMVIFVSELRRALRPADGETVWTNALFGGGILVAGSGALSAWLGFASYDAADHHDKAAFQALSYLSIDGWMPWVTGSAVFFLATGLAARRSAVLPGWFATVTAVLGVMCMLGPAGIAVFLVTPLWLAAAGVLLARRQVEAITPGSGSGATRSAVPVTQN